jgi:hypothetical protein
MLARTGYAGSGFGAVTPARLPGMSWTGDLGGMDSRLDEGAVVA